MNGGNVLDGYLFGLGRELANAVAHHLEAEAWLAQLDKSTESDEVIDARLDVHRWAAVIDGLKERIVDQTGERFWR